MIADTELLHLTAHRSSSCRLPLVPANLIEAELAKQNYALGKDAWFVC